LTPLKNQMLGIEVLRTLNLAIQSLIFNHFSAYFKLFSSKFITAEQKSGKLFNTSPEIKLLCLAPIFWDLFVCQVKILCW
jgi:hypothetical protein